MVIQLKVKTGQISQMLENDNVTMKDGPMNLKEYHHFESIQVLHQVKAVQFCKLSGLLEYG